MYETEAQRLQREADTYTKLLEHERKKYLILEDQFKQQREVLEDIKKQIKDKIPDEKKEHEAYVKRMSLHHQIANEEVLLNDTVGINKGLIENINIMRKEIDFAKKCIANMTAQIDNLKQEATKCNEKAFGQNKTANETNNEILALKSKHEEDKEEFEVEIKNLQQQLKERDKTMDFDDKGFNQNVQEKGGKGGKKTEFANPIEILKIRLNNIVAKNKEKKRLLD